MVAALCALFPSCQFPDYQFTVQVGGGGMTPMAGSDGTGLAGSAAGGSSAEAGGGGEETTAGAGGAGGTPPDPCGARPAPRPDGCFDGVLSENETDVDCGGPDCQPCFGATPLRVEYQNGDPNRTIKSPRFQLKVYNEGADSIPLSTIVLRYYFRRNGVTEPIHVRGGQAVWFQGSVPVDVSGDTTWTISRFNADEGDDFDAYLEIGFGVHELIPGDRVELYQELWGGNDSGDFDQATHYSFEASAYPFQDWPKVTAYRSGQLVWGIEPRRGGDESCFARGVNLNGPALTVDGDSWEDSSTAQVAVSGSAFSGQPADVSPPVAGTLAEALSTGYTLVAADGISVPVENGQYLAYVYAVSGTGTDAGSLAIEASAALDEFQAGPILAIPAWARLGPYAVDVSDGAFDVSCLGGTLRVAAIELRTPGTASY